MRSRHPSSRPEAPSGRPRRPLALLLLGLLAAGFLARPAQAQATLTLGNRVFHDYNDNGLYEPGLGEFGITAVKLNLYLDDGDGVLDAGDGAAIASTNSVGGGLYSFSGLAAGDYIVQVDAANFLAGGSLLGLKTARGNEVAGVAPDPDNDVDNDDNGYNVAGFSVASQAITLALGTEPANDGDVDADTNLSLDFGFYTPLCLGNQVFEDLDNDGIFEPGAGESGIDGVAVTLFRDTDASGTLTGGDAQLATAVTAGGGLYTYCDLGSGDYLVRVDAANFGAGGPLSGYVSSLLNAAAPDPDTDLDNDDNGAPVAGGAVATRAVTLSPGGEPDKPEDGDGIDGNLTVDLGFFQPGPAILLEKTVSTTGVCPGAQTVQVAPGTTVTYCYKVTNAGDTSLIDIDVTDNLLGAICTIAGPLAPGAMQTCSQTAAISADTTNVGTATGTPSDPAGQPLPGLPGVTDDDDAVVDVLRPAIDVQKTVYLGHTAGAGCGAAGELVSGITGTAITYCFKVTNTGEAALAPLGLTDATLGIDETDMTLLSGTSPLAPAAMAVFYYEATITGDLTNTVTATGTPLDDGGNPLPGATPPTDTDTAQVDGVGPGVLIEKTVSLTGVCPGADPLQVLSGTLVTYCFKVTNTGDTHLVNLAVTDNLLGPICAIAGPLAPGGMQTCTQTATINVDTTNVGTATGTPSDPAGTPLPGVPPVTDDDPAEVDVVAPALSLDKTVSTTGACPGAQTVQVAPGTTVTYCYKVTNTGDTPQADIQVTDNLLGAICTIAGPLAPGAMQTCSQTAVISADTTNVGTATGTPTDPAGNPIPGVPPSTDDDDAVVDVLRPAIDVQKTVYLGHTAGAGCGAAGELVSGITGAAITYCFKVTNTGEAALSPLGLTDATLGIDETDMTLLSGTSPLAPAAMAVFYYEATISGDLTNTVTATGTPLDDGGNPLPGATPPTDTDTAQVDGVGPGLLLEKTVSLTGTCPGSDTVQVLAGTQVTYCYKVTNAGDTHLVDIDVSDDLLGAICAIAGPLAPGGMQTCTQTATINVDTTNVGTATGTPSDPAGTPLPGVPPVTDDDPATVDVVAPALSLDKTVSTTGTCPGSQTVQVLAGTTVTYCYKVTNTGDTPQANIQVTDDLLGAICSIAGPLAPGAMQTCSQTAVINVDTTNVGTATGTPTDPAGNPIPGVPPSTDDDDAVVDVVPPATVCVGDQVFYDLDNDGIYEPGAGEFGISGVAVTVLADTDASGDLTGGDTVVATATTGVDGSFQACGLPAGDYIVRLDQSNFDPGGILDGLSSSSGNDVLGQAPDPDDDADDDDNGNPVPGQGVATDAVTLAPGTEPAAGVDGDGTDSNRTVDLGIIRTQSPTGVRLAGLSVDDDGGEITVSWSAADEEGVLGYHVDRSAQPNGPWARLTGRLLPVAEGRGQHRYSLADQPGPGRWYYRLEVLGSDGRSERYGPVLAQPRALAAGRIFLPFLGR